MKTFTLSNEVKMPAIGFGTFKLKEGEECYDAVRHALSANYRHIDTAAVYENEKSVGQAIIDSGVPRNEIFVTTKVWNSERGFDKTIQAFEDSLKRLQLDYLDLYLVHWPANAQQFENSKELNAETWKAMEKLYKSGRVKSIGVSNFLKHHLEDLLETAEIVPMVNQIEFHPGYLQEDTVGFCKEKGILVEAWSPLGQGQVLEDPTLLALANKYNTSTSEICLQFALQQGICVLPKSATPARIAKNIQVNIELEKADLQEIIAMNQVGFTGLNPDTVPF